MRKVWVSNLVREKIADIETYLVDELKLSEEAALRRSGRMREYIRALSNAADYPVCRFRKRKISGYRCTVFEKDWIFAYEVFKDGIVIRDMSHTSLLSEL
jgi:hypothetical protein